jgi:streptomycin 6-kinase
MPSVEVALLIFIMAVVGIGGGWFLYDANRDEDEE